MGQILHAHASDDITAIDSLGERHPEFSDLNDVASGLLFLPIANNPGDAIIWFRGEIARAIDWAGDPQKSMEISPETGRVSSRKSFQAWREVVQGRSAPWAAADLGAARDLRRLIASGLLRNAEANLARLSNVDPLTGLANRRALDESHHKIAPDKLEIEQDLFLALTSKNSGWSINR